MSGKPSRGHSHGPLHAQMCAGLDHQSASYTPQQRADLDLVLGFNHAMAEAIDSGLDVSETQELLDPDPLRYMWVDEGQGQIASVIEAAHLELARAPRLEEHRRREAAVLEGSHRAARPSIATGPDGARLCVWVEWVPEQGDLVRTSLRPGGEAPEETAGTVPHPVGDVFRPTALISAHGVPWVFFGARVEGEVTILASRLDGGAWTAPEPVSTSPPPSFNQEVVAHADGSVEVCWQGRHKDQFGIYSRTFAGAEWSSPVLVSAGVEANVWDPAVAAFADGGAAYAWSEYRDGAYRVVVRTRDRLGLLDEGRDLTSGTDYALHPSLAVTADQQLWCAFDVITVAGHGGSGPTRLRPLADVGLNEGADGMRAAGDSIPPELLPEVSASIRVVAVCDTGVREAPGVLAPALTVVPSGLPKLVALPDGGLAVSYRVNRKLPLMTYYWEVATQVLGTGGWSGPTTFRGTDGTLEEVAVAATPTGMVLAAQTDGRLARALQWTEGFGGRECPYLMEHHGAVIWHGVHGIGAVVTAEVPGAGAVPGSDAQVGPRATVEVSEREEARRWARGTTPETRYVARVGERDYTLYWGDLHRHSLVSRCTAGDEPSLEDFYRYAWDVCEYDFWAVTDHSENSTDYQWWSIQKIADLFHVPDRFVPFYGFEWTSADTGHQNVIYGDVERGAPIFSAFAEGTTDPTGLWEGLAAHPDYPAITIPHHPGSAMVHNDWDYHDPRYSRLVEIFQACRGNYEADGAFRQYSDGTREATFVVDGLLRGHRFGLIASSDHGHGASYVGAFAQSLTRASVFEALQSRRTFAATTRSIVVDARIGETFMGEESVAEGPRELTVHAEGYAELARVDVVRNGEVVHALTPDLDLPAGWSVVPLRVEWGASDTTTVWDGRLSVRGGRVLRTPYWSPEVVAVTEHSVAWRNTTHSFGEPYGAQRGGIEVSVVGPPEATVVVDLEGRHTEVSLADLAASSHVVRGAVGVCRLQPGIGGLTGLGSNAVDLTWTDDHDEAAFYYVRVFGVDGEMAWSSPIWVTPATDAPGATRLASSVPSAGETLV